MLKRFSVLTLLLGASLLGTSMLAGCGQKGPLFLPVENSSTEADKQEKPAKNTQDEDAATD